MINKDLNLSLDQNQTRPVRPSDTSKTTATLTSQNPGISTVPLPSTPPKLQIQPPAYKVSAHHMLIGIVITNAVILLSVGILMAEFFEHGSGSNRINSEMHSITTVGIVELGDQVTTLQQQLAVQGEALELQLQDILLTFRVDQQQIVSDYLDMAEQLQSIINPPQKTIPAMSPQTSAITNPNSWYVNIGTFVNKKAALGLQKQIVDLGYPATTSTLEFDGKIAQRVQIAGYADRASAETVAQKIMKTTKLNGLWARKGK